MLFLRLQTAASIVSSTSRLLTAFSFNSSELVGSDASSSSGRGLSTKVLLLEGDMRIEYSVRLAVVELQRSFKIRSSGFPADSCLMQSVWATSSKASEMRLTCGATPLCLSVCPVSSVLSSPPEERPSRRRRSPRSLEIELEAA